jgi:hypothetical protein
MKIGSLYEIKKWYWLLFPSKDIAAATSPRTCDTPSAEATAGGYADYWSREFNCNVLFIPQNSMFMLLEQDGKYCKILTTNGELGWISYPVNEVWAKGCIEEVKDQ